MADVERQIEALRRSNAKLDTRNALLVRLETQRASVRASPSQPKSGLSTASLCVARLVPFVRAAQQSRSRGFLNCNAARLVATEYTPLRISTDIMQRRLSSCITALKRPSAFRRRTT